MDYKPRKANQGWIYNYVYDKLTSKSTNCLDLRAKISYATRFIDVIGKRILARDS